VSVLRRLPLLWTMVHRLASGVIIPTTPTLARPTVITDRSGFTVASSSASARGMDGAGGMVGAAATDFAAGTASAAGTVIVAE
jgi:hypothetical protein